LLLKFEQFLTKSYFSIIGLGAQWSDQKSARGICCPGDADADNSVLPYGDVLQVLDLVADPSAKPSAADA